MSKHLLFLCSQNKLRSPTAEAVFSDYDGVEVDSAGLNDSAEIPVTPEHLTWADHIFVMETKQKARLNNKFGSQLKGKRVTVLNIPDNYAYMEDALVQLFKKKCASYF